ncbi:MAG: M1 family metallopeptidase [Flavobacteriales bacterium]|nr:M1 family metallopeptidase [Flavobacteriales bacterium]
MTRQAPLLRTLSFALLSCPILACAQLGDGQQHFTRTDSLRGSIGPYRAWWDVTHYDVSVTPDFQSKSIVGITTISFSANVEGKRMQVDLQEPLVMDSITTSVATFRDGDFLITEQAIQSTRNGNVLWVELPTPMIAGEVSSITVYYHGTPRAAKNPPWDGGWIWRTDEQGNPWMSVACQGLGASVWYPCKDHQSDEPDSAALHITVPDSLEAIGNGRLRGRSHNNNGTTTWNWAVSNPINSYNLVPYIGKYAHFGEVYAGVQGKLDLDYWVLAYNETKAREHFMQVPLMLNCFEEWLGPYPFYKDGYKLVESPHLGMEHQSAVAYGNKFMNGYLGTDRSKSGHGLKWDYIIIHESGHEWFGNSITTADIADMWIHEGFTDYTETIYTECQSGKQAAEEYVVGLRADISNDKPLIGPYGVNQEGSGDMYNKGANLIHMVRHIVGDSTFKAMLLEMNRRFFHKTVTSTEIEEFMINFNERTKTLLNKSIFDQYLRTVQIPVLEYAVKKNQLWVRWTNCSAGFHMPVNLAINEETGKGMVGTDWIRLYGTSNNATVPLVDRNWYVTSKKADKDAQRSIPKTLLK